MTDSTAITKLDDAVVAVLDAAGIDPAMAPVDPRRVAAWMGLEVREGSGGAEGSLRLRNGRAVVEVSPWGPVKRKRFTMAHEVGHAFLLYPERNLSGSVVRRWSDIELFCNDFAASLLLPRPWLVARIEAADRDLAGLRGVADDADVSLAATSQRLVRSGLWAHALIEWTCGEDGWRVCRAGGMHADLRKRLRLARSTERQLARLAGRRSGVGMRLCVMLDEHELRELDANVQLHNYGARMLVPVRFDGYAWEPRWRPGVRSVQDDRSTRAA